MLGSGSPVVTLHCIDYCKMLTSGHFQDQGQVQTKDLGVKRADGHQSVGADDLVKVLSMK